MLSGQKSRNPGSLLKAMAKPVMAGNYIYYIRGSSELAAKPPEGYKNHASHIPIRMNSILRATGSFLLQTQRAQNRASTALTLTMSTGRRTETTGQAEQRTVTWQSLLGMMPRSDQHTFYRARPFPNSHPGREALTAARASQT